MLQFVAAGHIRIDTTVVATVGVGPVRAAVIPHLVSAATQEKHTATN